MPLLFYLRLLSCYLVSSMWICSNVTPLQAFCISGHFCTFVRGELEVVAAFGGFSCLVLFEDLFFRLKVFMLKFNSAGRFLIIKPQSECTKNYQEKDG